MAQPDNPIITTYSTGNRITKIDVGTLKEGDETASTAVRNAKVTKSHFSLLERPPENTELTISIAGNVSGQRNDTIMLLEKAASWCSSSSRST